MVDEFNYFDGQQPTPEPAPMAPESPQASAEGQDVVGQPLDTQIDQEIIQMVVNRQKASQQWRDPYRLEWDEAKDNYEQVYDSTGKDAWQATTFQPMTTTFVERSTAALHSMSMGSEAPVEYQPRSPIYEQTVDCTNDIIQHDLEMSGFKVQWADFCRNLSLYGTAIGKTSYLKEEATVMVKKRKKPMMPMLQGLMQSFGGFFGMGAQEPQEQLIPERKIVKDWATFKNVDIYNIYPQPHIEEITKDTWIIEKFKITNKELMDGARNPDPYYRLDNVTMQLLMNGSAVPNNDPQLADKRMAENDWEVPLPYLQPDQEHEGLEYWGPVPKWFLNPSLKDDELAKYEVEYAWIWVIDGQWLVRKRITPFIDACPPYDKGNYIRRPGQFYGIGNGKLLVGLQAEKNEIRNTRQDNINLLLNKIFAVLKDKVSKEEWQNLISDPGQIWPFSGIDDVRKVIMPLDVPDITQDSWRGSAEVDREAQEVTDVIKTTQTIGAGEDQAGNGTFRGQMLNHEVANERFKLYASVLEISALKKIIDRIYQRIYQFKSYEQIEKIIGPKRAQNFELVPCEDLNDIAKLISLGSLTTQNKGLQLAQMRDFYLQFGQEPFFKKLDYARKEYRLIGSGSDPDEVMFSDEEMAILNDVKRQTIGMGMPPSVPQGQPNGLPPAPGGPVAGNQPPPMNGMPRPPMPPRGPGASPFDMVGRPM